MRNILLIFSLALVTFFFACDDQSVDELKMGEEYINDESGVVLIDTFSLELSTVVIDSIQTSDIASVLVGDYNHERFGGIISEPAFRLGLPSNADFDEDDVFDSLTICMNYNNYYVGDTTGVFSLDVKELATDWDDLDESTFYNVTEIDVKEESLGHIEFLPRPNKGKKLEKRLNDSFGQRLFGLFIDDADEIQTDNDFQEYFYGLALQGNKANGTALGFAQNDTSVYLKMYYHRSDIETEELEATFKIDDASYLFNQITANRNETAFEPLIEQKKHLRSTETDDMTLIQGSTGLMSKIRFPALNNVLQLVELNQIIKVELVLVPLDETEDINDMPTELLMYESNRVNLRNSSSVYTNSSGDYVYLELNQAEDNYESKAYYSADITDFIIENLLAEEFKIDNYDKCLLVGLSTTEEQETLTTVMLGGEKNMDYKPKLNIYTYYY